MKKDCFLERKVFGFFKSFLHTNGNSQSMTFLVGRLVLNSVKWVRKKCTCITLLFIEVCVQGEKQATKQDRFKHRNFVESGIQNESWHSMSLSFLPSEEWRGVVLTFCINNSCLQFLITKVPVYHFKKIFPFHQPNPSFLGLFKFYCFCWRLPYSFELNFFFRISFVSRSFSSERSDFISKKSCGVSVL